MPFDAKYLTLEELDRYYQQAEAHLEPQLLQAHLREVLAGGPANLTPEIREENLNLRHAGERLRLDWEQSRAALSAREGETDACSGT